MGRTAMAQAEHVSENMVAMIKGALPSEYKPKVIDGLLKLSLGLVSLEDALFLRSL